MSKFQLTDDFFADLSSSTLPLGDAETLPPECYTDRDFYEFEKDAVFEARMALHRARILGQQTGQLLHHRYRRRT